MALLGTSTGVHTKLQKDTSYPTNVKLITGPDLLNYRSIYSIANTRKWSAFPHSFINSHSFIKSHSKPQTIIKQHSTALIERPRNHKVRHAPSDMSGRRVPKTLQFNNIALCSRCVRTLWNWLVCMPLRRLHIWWKVLRFVCDHK